MGVDYHVRLSTYVRCANTKVDGKQSFFTCESKGCTLNGFALDTPFCPSCGKPRTNKPINKKVIKVDPFEMCEQFKDVLYHVVVESGKEDCVYYFPNKSDANEPDLPSFDPKERETFVMKVDPRDMDSHVDWFNNKFNKEIKALEKAYGEDNVSVEFGLLNQVS